MKTGFISVIGRPNVGKSSLINALVGQKVSIVSPKAQTTRDRILGIYTDDECQMIFVDTPGVHKAKNKLGKYMEDCVRSATGGVDIILVVADVSKKITDKDVAFIESYLYSATPVMLVLNKTDLSSYEKIYPVLSQLSFLLSADGTRRALKEIVPVSAKKQDNIEELKKTILSYLSEGELLYPEDEVTDKSERYMICEIVREKALMLLGDEIPHGIGVYIEDMEYDEAGTAHINVDIVVEKQSHKPIVIGEGGQKLKAVAEAAREDIEKMLDAKAFMEIFVKVRKNWRNDALTMNDIGYNSKKNL